MSVPVVDIQPKGRGEQRFCAGMPELLSTAYRTAEMDRLPALQRKTLHLTGRAYVTVVDFHPDAIPGQHGCVMAAGLCLESEDD